MVIAPLTLRTAYFDHCACTIVFPGFEPIPEEVIESDPVHWRDVLQTIDVQLSFDFWMQEIAQQRELIK